MKTITYQSLTKFEFWSGGKDNAELLTHYELVLIDQYLSDMFPEGLEDVCINDMFWFEFDDICTMNGLDPEVVQERSVS